MSSRTKVSKKQPSPLIPFRYALNCSQKLDRGDVIVIEGEPLEVRTIDKVNFDMTGIVLIYGKGRDF